MFALNKSVSLPMLPISLGAIIGISFLYFFYASIDPDVKFEELALGEENTSSVELVNGLNVHCHDLTDSYKCIDDYKNSKLEDDVVLWLGNSQLHSINQKQPGDVTAGYILHKHAKIDNKYYLTYSQPNASLQEHYLLFEYLVDKLPITTLVLPVVFDDMRETGIRFSLLEALKNKTVSMNLNRTKIGKVIATNQIEQDMAGNEMHAIENTVQDVSENYLNDKLSEIWGVWAGRANLRGDVLNNLYIFRNWLFGIGPSSIRRMIPSRYNLNMQALKAILMSASEKKIKVLLYIVPLRNDVTVPYDLIQYQKFKKETLFIAEELAVNFSNFEHLVPAKYWGTKNATTIGGGQELDFMHFQAGGHKLIAEAIYRELKEIWLTSDSDHDF